MIKSEHRLKRETEEQKRLTALENIREETTSDLANAWDGFYDADLRADDPNQAGIWRSWATRRGYTPEMVEDELNRRDEA